jgi:ABC-type multidrug transport system ATPase subunit
LGLGKKGKEFDILKDFKGVAQPGEMVLVLGRPGSGCTTFLKVIANQRFGYTKVDGNVLYGPFESDFFEKRYRGEAVYCEEDENHHPTLTVGQTLDFALETKVPGKLPAGMSRQSFKEKVIDLMLKMYNIEHTRNTIVGNPFVRGVSGGERKRVSIAETMITGASLMVRSPYTLNLLYNTLTPPFSRSITVHVVWMPRPLWTTPGRSGC